MGSNCVRPWAFPYRALYSSVMGDTNPPTPAPDLDATKFSEFMRSRSTARGFTILGQNQTSLLSNDGEWNGFNYTGNAGRASFVDGIQGCTSTRINPDAGEGVTLPGQADQYVNWSVTSVFGRRRRSERCGRNLATEGRRRRWVLRQRDGCNSRSHDQQRLGRVARQRIERHRLQLRRRVRAELLLHRHHGRLSVARAGNAQHRLSRGDDRRVHQNAQVAIHHAGRHPRQLREQSGQNRPGQVARDGRRAERSEQALDGLDGRTMFRRRRLPRRCQSTGRMQAR